MQLDHLVILVKDLDAAIEDYDELGFNVVPGGTHADGLTANALIPFADATYLELIAFTERDEPQPHRWWSFTKQGGGLIDYALLSQDLPNEVTHLAAEHLLFDGPHESGRARPDGTRLAWRGAFAPSGSALPFLIQDLTPRKLRVPQGEITDHPNGVRGIARVIVGVSDVNSTAKSYGKLLAIDPPASYTDRDLEAETAEMKIAPSRVVLAQPQSADLPLALQVERRGSGIYAAWLLVDEPVATMGWLNPRRTHGARLQIMLEDELDD